MFSEWLIKHMDRYSHMQKTIDIIMSYGENILRDIEIYDDLLMLMDYDDKEDKTFIDARRLWSDFYHRKDRV